MKSLLSSGQKPVQILYINSMSKISGAELSLLDLMVNLDRCQFQPIFLCPSPGPFTDLCTQNKIPTILLPSLLPNFGKASRRFRRFIPNAIEIARIAKKEHIRLIHSNNPRVGYSGGLGARLSGIPSVVHARDYYRTPFNSVMKSLFLRAISDRIITVSRATYDAVTTRLPALKKNTRIIYDGISPLPVYSQNEIDSFRYKFGMQRKKPLLAVVGALSELKDQENAIKAMHVILVKFPDAKLLVVGEPIDHPGEVYEMRLRNTIQRLGIERNVILTGFRNDIPLLMSSIDLLIHVPALPEALGRVIIEASLQGTMVIGSAIGGIKEIILDGQTGILVPPGQPDQISEAVIQLLNNPLKADQMRRSAIERVKKEFTIERYVSQIQDVYNELLTK
jgi:glycosyltransferase involved in cell wall biosynthesis